VWPAGSKRLDTTGLEPGHDGVATALRLEGVDVFNFSLCSIVHLHSLSVLLVGGLTLTMTGHLQCIDHQCTPLAVI